LIRRRSRHPISDQTNIAGRNLEALVGEWDAAPDESGINRGIDGRT
jgi:hypothetical protein